MSRPYYNTKFTVEESVSLSIAQLKRRRLLEPGENTDIMTWPQSRVIIHVHMIDKPYVELIHFTSDRNRVTMPCKSEADLLTTPCNLGGVRYWFACPWCGIRVGSIYLVPGGGVFKCRDCYNLTYRSRNRSVIEAFGDVSTQIKKLRGQIKRWTWRGRPTRKVKRLRRLERRMAVFGSQTKSRIHKLRARLSRPR